MAIADYTTLDFSFGSKTVIGTGFGSNNAIAAGDTAYFNVVSGPVFCAVGGVHFSYSSAGQASNIDAGNSGAINVRGTDTLAPAPSRPDHSFSNVTLDLGIVFGSAAVSFLNSTGAVLAAFTENDFSGGGSLYFAGKFDAIRFKSSVLMNINSLTFTVICFIAGTKIDTPSGPKNIENLATGDFVTTMQGDAIEIQNIGRQTVFPTFQAPSLINPICIMKGALGYGFPSADLFMSSDHGIEIDGVIYTAGSLVNSDTIFQSRNWPTPDFNYYHIECAEHVLILANGVSVETFVDYTGRQDLFPNSKTQTPIKEMPLPRVSSASKVPKALIAHLGKQWAA